MEQMPHVTPPLSKRVGNFTFEREKMPNGRQRDEDLVSISPCAHVRNGPIKRLINRRPCELQRAPPPNKLSARAMEDLLYAKQLVLG